MTETVERLFVYGTLMRRHPRSMFHLLGDRARFLGDARTRGRLVDLGDYPGLVPSDDANAWVAGEVYEVRPSSGIWDRLDRYEGCAAGTPEPHEFERVVRRVVLDSGEAVEAWVYLHVGASERRTHSIAPARCRVRDATVEDIPRVLEIRSDPLNLAEQYPLTRHDTEGAISESISREGSPVERTWKYSVILVDDAVVGYVTSIWAGDPPARVCVCGWDLTPSHWGRGIMPVALSLLFDELFAELDVRLVVADCFPTNARCIRVLERLGFVPRRPSLLERVLHVIRARGFRRLRSFALDSDTWRRRQADSPPRGS